MFQPLIRYPMSIDIILGPTRGFANSEIPELATFGVTLSYRPAY